MSKYDFQPLYDQYPNVIAQMPESFTSHEFILRLAHQNQVDYIEALYSYRDYRHAGTIAPFQAVHMTLAGHLNRCPEVENLGQVRSQHIFGEWTTCAKGRKRRLADLGAT